MAATFQSQLLCLPVLQLHTPLLYVAISIPTEQVVACQAEGQSIHMCWRHLQHVQSNPYTCKACAAVSPLAVTPIKCSVGTSNKPATH